MVSISLVQTAVNNKSSFHRCYVNIYFLLTESKDVVLVFCSFVGKPGGFPYIEGVSLVAGLCG